MRGRADLLALLASLALGAAALAPAALLRGGDAWRSSPEAQRAAAERAAAPGEEGRVAGFRLDPADPALATPPFHPDPSRPLGPDRPPAPAAPRITDLRAEVVEGRLHVRWTTPPGCRTVDLRKSETGYRASDKGRVPAGQAGEWLVPLRSTRGTAEVRATPVTAEGAGEEAVVAVPFSIPVEAEVLRADVETASADFRLRRVFDGRLVEAEFSVSREMPLGGWTRVGPAGGEVEFATGLALQGVARNDIVRNDVVRVPVFRADGTVERDPAGAPVSRLRPELRRERRLEVTLRGPGGVEKVLTVEP